jgi:uncharacterized protein DUF2550
VAEGGGAVALDAIWLFAVFLALIVLAAAVLATRRFLLERGGGTIECGLRSPAGRGTWHLGVVSYSGDELSWHDTLGVLLRPEQVFHRRQLTIVSRRQAVTSEAATLGADDVVVEICTDAADDHMELAMTEQAYTGFLAWLEASPPGSHLQDIA